MLMLLDFNINVKVRDKELIEFIEFIEFVEFIEFHLSYLLLLYAFRFRLK